MGEGGGCGFVSDLFDYHFVGVVTGARIYAFTVPTKAMALQMTSYQTLSHKLREASKI